MKNFIILSISIFFFSSLEKVYAQEVNAEKTDFGIYKNFTFEPGNKIIFYDDFINDRVGDFPKKWGTNGSGEIVTNNQYEGKWLLLSGRSGYVPSPDAPLPEDYTIEFDLATNGFKENKAGNALSIAFIKKKSFGIGAAGGYATLRINLNKNSLMAISTSGAENSTRVGSTLNRKFNLDTKVHVSIAVNKNRLRIWMDEEKITDIPSLLIGNMGRYILFEAYEIHPDKGHTVLISNFKIADSKENVRSGLLEKGKFTTTGIYFNTDKAIIKAESYAVLKSVADYLTENPEVKIKVVGHTDSQGEDAYNLTLSEKRAQAVILSLSEQFKIDKSRLTAIGKGETEPIDDNKTEKGRANNRRVEFIKE